MGKTFRSIDDLRDFVETMKEGFPDLSMEIEEQVAEGETVVTAGSCAARTTANSWEMSGIGIFHLQDGKVSERSRSPTRSR